jgi:hypothetical protein
MLWAPWSASSTQGATTVAVLSRSPFTRAPGCPLSFNGYSVILAAPTGRSLEDDEQRDYDERRDHQQLIIIDVAPSLEGIFVYHPGHRQVPASLRAFIDMLRATSGSALPRSLRKNPFAKDRSVGR